MVKIILSFIIAVICGVLYRMGGSDKYDTKWRDFGCPLCAIGTLLLWFTPTNWWMLLPWFGLAFGAMTTYWDKIFGYDNYYFHGFMAGLASFPMYWAGVNWYSVLIYAVVCGGLIGLWSKLNDDAVKEEFGRGFIYCVSTLCLLI